MQSPNYCGINKNPLILIVVHPQKRSSGLQSPMATAAEWLFARIRGLKGFHLFRSLLEVGLGFHAANRGNGVNDVNQVFDGFWDRG